MSPARGAARSCAKTDDIVCADTGPGCISLSVRHGAQRASRATRGRRAGARAAAVRRRRRAPCGAPGCGRFHTMVRSCPPTPTAPGAAEAAQGWLPPDFPLRGAGGATCSRSPRTSRAERVPPRAGGTRGGVAVHHGAQQRHAPHGARRGVRAAQRWHEPRPHPSTRRTPWARGRRRTIHASVATTSSVASFSVCSGSRRKLGDRLGTSQSMQVNRWRGDPTRPAHHAPPWRYSTRRRAGARAAHGCGCATGTARPAPAGGGARQRVTSPSAG